MNHKKEMLMQAVFFLTACISILSVLLICIFLFMNGLPAIQEIGWGNFLFGTVWRPANHLFGIFPMIIGSLYVTAGALVTGVPIGILTAVFMAHFCPEKWYRPLKAAINLMAGIPSVVYGFFGLVVLVPFVRDQIGGFGMGVLTASILLGLMILPTIISVSEAAIRAVPSSYYEGGLALGPPMSAVSFLQFCQQPSGVFWRRLFWELAGPSVRPWRLLWWLGIRLCCLPLSHPVSAP